MSLHCFYYCHSTVNKLKSIYRHRRQPAAVS